jgi:hypothetical protein
LPEKPKVEEAFPPPRPEPEFVEAQEMGMYSGLVRALGYVPRLWRSWRVAHALRVARAARAAKLVKLQSRLKAARESLNWNLQQSEHAEAVSAELKSYFAARIRALRAEIEGLETAIQNLPEVP